MLQGGIKSAKGRGVLGENNKNKEGGDLGVRIYTQLGRECLLLRWVSETWYQIRDCAASLLGPLWARLLSGGEGEVGFLLGNGRGCNSKGIVILGSCAARAVCLAESPGTAFCVRGFTL